MSGGGGGRAGGAGASIPAGARRVVQSLKEIVNCPEAEIYAMLRECNMDPSEAVHRLLSQDTFHEVKSKREKKKETKETPESRSRATSNSSNRGVRGGTIRGGNINLNQFTSNDDGATRGKPIFKKENGVNTIPTSSILGPGVPANIPNRSGSAIGENTTQITAVHDGVSLPSHPLPVSQQNWFGGPGHVTMADIVKRGRPQGKSCSASIAASDTPYASHGAVMPNINAEAFPIMIPTSKPKRELDFSQDIVSKVPEINHETGVIGDQHASAVKESPAGSGPAVVEVSAPSAIHDASSSVPDDGVNVLVNSQSDDIRVLEGDSNGGSPLTESDEQAKMDNLGDDSGLADDSLDNTNSFQSQRHVFEHYEVEDGDAEISSAAAGMQQLSLHKEDLHAPSVGHRPAVIIPNHLQVTDVDCSHLSFGSFGSGVDATFSGSFPSNPLQSNLDVAPVSDDAPVVDQLEARNSEYYDNGQLRPTTDVNVDTRTGADNRIYDTPAASQPDIIRNDTLDATHGLQYNIPSVSGYSLPSSTQANVAAYTYPQTNAHMQNLAPFSSLMQPYNSPLPSNPLASTLPSTLPSVRNSDLLFSPFLTTQSIPTKYNTSTSSVSGQTSSTPEAVKPGVFSSEPTQQTLPSTSIPTGPTLPQHLPVQQFSQHTFPLGHFANMIGYPFLPPSYTYMPSAAFQQTYTGNSGMHQSPGGLQSAGIKYNLPQYKSNVSISNLPQSAVVAPGYGGFGSSIPGSYTMNPAPSASSTIDEALSSQYKEGNHFIVQQSENPAMWAQGAGSRTMSALPASTFYSFLGQGQHSGFRQGQQPSPLANLGYTNMYQSHAGVSQEHQRNPSEGNLNGSQGVQSQQSHQMWQHSY